MECNLCCTEMQQHICFLWRLGSFGASRQTLHYSIMLYSKIIKSKLNSMWGLCPKDQNESLHVLHFTNFNMQEEGLECWTTEWRNSNAKKFFDQYGKVIFIIIWLWDYTNILLLWSYKLFIVIYLLVVIDNGGQVQSENVWEIKSIKVLLMTILYAIII